MNPQEFGSFGGKNQYELVKSLNYSFFFQLFSRPFQLTGTPRALGTTVKGRFQAEVYGCQASNSHTQKLLS